jgi:hypothetical protein
MLLVNFILRSSPVVKSVYAGEVALRDQFRLRREPMLHFVAGQ